MSPVVLAYHSPSDAVLTKSRGVLQLERLRTAGFALAMRETRPPMEWHAACTAMLLRGKHDGGRRPQSFAIFAEHGTGHMKGPAKGSMIGAGAHERGGAAPPTSALRVLLVEDSEDDALLVVRALRRGGYDPRWQRVDTAAALEAALMQQRWDVVLSDYLLPGLDARAILSAIRAQRPDVPVIIVSGERGAESAVTAMKSGAVDYVLKDHLHQLVATVERELGIAAARRRAAPAHRATERPDDLVDDLDAIVWEADPASFRFSFVSRRAEDILGYPVARWLNEPDFRLRMLHPEDRDAAIASWRRATLEGREHRIEFRAVAADGRVVWLRDSLRIVRDQHGRPQRLRGMMVDISDAKRTA